MYKTLEQSIKERILVLDGAIGTMIQQYSFTENDYRGLRFADATADLKGNYEILVLTQPKAILDIHKAYLAAGADIIETNTLNATAVSLADYACEDLAYEINLQAATLARQAADEFSTPEKPRFVAGSIGPTSKSLSISPDVNAPALRSVTFETLYNAYFEQVSGLIDGKVDALLVETVFDTLNAKAALVAIQDCLAQKSVQLPVMLSVTLSDTSGRTLSGQTLEAFYITFSSLNLFSIGLNCGCGTIQMMPFAQELSQISRFNVCIYPNAGFPNQLGQYEQSPETMVADIETMLKNGYVNIIGGCCGSTPEHIKLIAEKAALYPPRQILNIGPITAFSGWETVKILSKNNFVNIGERTNVAGSKKFARLIRDRQFEEALSIAAKQIEDGAQIIDICMDDAMINSEEAMHEFLNLIASEPNIAKVPIMIDSSKWEVIKTGLQATQGKSIVNSISLKDGEKAFLEKAAYIQKFGAAVVVILFDENGQADTFERKIEIAGRAYRSLKTIDFPPQDIIFDSNVLAISTGVEAHNSYAVDFIKSCKWIKENLPHVKLSGGISNLSFSYRGNDAIREAMHAVFLYHAIANGLDMGIVNPSSLIVYNEIEPKLLQLIEDVVLNKNSDATERLLEYGTNLTQQKSAEIPVTGISNFSADEQLQNMLIKGVSENIEPLLDELLQQYGSPVQIIEKSLMQAMNSVGDLFGAGKMFLPQVIKSARVIKKAVSYLEPLIEQEKLKNNTLQSARKILLATVKGDVHDIGKNIVGIVLSCSGCQVIDLGVMVPAKEIIDAAIRENADIIGLCGLITPSLDEMIRVFDEAKNRNLNIPFMIGGAAASQLHTAVAMADKYEGGVVYVKDASRSVDVVKNLLSVENKENYLKQITADYQKIKQQYEEEQKNKKTVSLETARLNKIQIQWDDEQIIKPEFLGIKVFKNLDIADLIPFINWKEIYHVFAVKNSAEEQEKLRRDCERLLANTERHFERSEKSTHSKNISVRAVIGIFEANAQNEDIIIFEQRKEICRLHAKRSLAMSEKNPSLADFIAPLEYGKRDYIGCFAATTEVFMHTDDEYQKVLVKALSDALVEAASEFLHQKVRTELWKFSHQGIRPAVGYPVYPEHIEKRKIFDILNAEININVRLTETYAIIPSSSVCGLYFANKNAKYFNVPKKI
jgi:5-methyltetrahydrofolate--homocysteine methyltransferase